MSTLYGETHRAFQDERDTRRLADRLESLAHTEFNDDERAFIERLPFFFLSTVDTQGRPTVSYKGGAPGFVRVTAPGELTFPIYDGNGMYLSLGNIAGTTKVGLLFIDFESPRRLRVQGTAHVARDDGGPRSVPGAQYVVQVIASEIFVNCGRYIHRFGAPSISPHVPSETGRQPFPAWKRLDFLADTLPPRDQQKVAEAGGAIPLEAYPGEDSPDFKTTVS
jgi:predicted pyridoxine 5'-phosphate oxidase superfamily flavin-nucleotide-binding protein